jgi:hypothetical protein
MDVNARTDDRRALASVRSHSSSYSRSCARAAKLTSRSRRVSDGRARVPLSELFPSVPVSGATSRAKLKL